MHLVHTEVHFCQKYTKAPYIFSLFYGKGSKNRQSESHVSRRQTEEGWSGHSQVKA